MRFWPPRHIIRCAITESKNNFRSSKPWVEEEKKVEWWENGREDVLGEGRKLANDCDQRLIL